MKKFAERMQVQPSPPPAAAEDQGPTLEPQPRRAFRARTLPLDCGFDVKIAGSDAFEDEIFIQYESNRLVIVTGREAAALKAGAAVPPPQFTQPNRLRAARRSEPPAPAPGFVSHSTLHVDDPIDYPELREPNAEGEDENVVRIQPNGMPVAPRDRTRAQRQALVVPDESGTPALVLSPEAIAKAP